MGKHTVLCTYLLYCMVYGKHTVFGEYLLYCMVYGYLVGCISAIWYGIWVSIACWVHIFNTVWYMGKHIVIGAYLLYCIWVSISCLVHIFNIV